MTDIGIEPSPLLRRRGALAGPAAFEDVVLTPSDAGWTYCGLRVLRLAPGEPVTVPTGESEVFVLPLAGSLRVEVEAEPSRRERYELEGRRSVFTSATDLVYGVTSAKELKGDHAPSLWSPSSYARALIAGRDEGLKAYAQAA